MEFAFTFAALVQTAATLYLYSQMRHRQQRKVQMVRALRTWAKMDANPEEYLR